MASSKARILIVDDHPIVREGLCMRLSSQVDLLVCGEAASVDEALACCHKERPDLITVDITLGRDSGLDLIRRLNSQGYTGRILVLSAHEDTLYAERALKAGAHGYIGKSEAQNDILKAVRLVLEGGCYLSLSMSRQLIGQAVTTSSRPASPLGTLTTREFQVFELIGQGLSAKAIASRLHLSPNTIDSHREKIKAKLCLYSGLELQHAAMRWCLAPGGSATRR